MKCSDDLKNHRSGKRFLTICFFLYILLIFWITVFSRKAGSHHEIMLMPFQAWGDSIEDHRHFVGNFLMMIPTGILLPAINTKWKSWKKIVIVCLVFSFVLEFLQVMTGRGDFQVDDLWSNSLSGLLGYWILLMSEEVDR